MTSSNLQTAQNKDYRLPRKGDQPWIFIRRTDTEAVAPLLWPLDEKRQLMGKDAGAGKDGKEKEKEQQRTRWLDSICDSVGMSLSRPWETVKDREAWHPAVPGVAKRWTRLSGWTTTARRLKHKEGYAHCRRENRHLPILKIRKMLEENIIRLLQVCQAVLKVWFGDGIPMTFSR